MSDKLLPGAFRVWDSLLNEYVGEYPEFSISRNGVLMQNSDYEPDAPADSGRYTVERFTGFYDADNRPIFEGDVIYCQFIGKNAKVWQEFTDTRGLWVLGWTMTPCLADVLELDECKIVGTIHDQEVDSER